MRRHAAIPRDASANKGTNQAVILIAVSDSRSPLSLPSALYYLKSKNLSLKIHRCVDSALLMIRTWKYFSVLTFSQAVSRIF